MIEGTQAGLMGRRGALRLSLMAGLAAVAATRAHAAAKDEIGIDNFTFSPAVLRAKKGEVVTWVNHDDIPHSIVLMALKVHSAPMDTDGTYSFTFNQPGVYNYICGLHPHMKGQIVVSG